MIDDTVPHLNQCCGADPKASYGPISVISCTKCEEAITVETSPFFRNPERQREHQAWRATAAWNEKMKD
ncbi:hypothetical protein [Rhizobium johnstonii]|uniref:hypothetical protein n=1 Tax=Rhizobium johnstonii TaxID=3019933 RepID=UPI003F9C8BA8